MVVERPDPEAFAIASVEVGADPALGRALRRDQPGAAVGTDFPMAWGTGGDHPAAGALELALASDLHRLEPRVARRAGHPWNTAFLLRGSAARSPRHGRCLTVRRAALRPGARRSTSSTATQTPGRRRGSAPPRLAGAHRGRSASELRRSPDGDEAEPAEAVRGGGEEARATTSLERRSAGRDALFGAGRLS